MGGCYDKNTSKKAALQTCYDTYKDALAEDIDTNGACKEGETCVMKKVKDLLDKVTLRAP